ncbi:MAG: hypothetical protein JNL92_00035 [Opitutaceae bacterium]|nr:hypothetical protein [Opitutaceae bacterium]
MLSALLYLRATSFRNWVVARVRRLRQPKYLLGAIVGGAYFYFFFFRSLATPPGPRAGTALPDAAREAMEAAVTLPADWLPATTAFGSLALLIFTTFMWVVPTQRAALGFSEAEIAFLFPAPVKRRSLVHFRLISAQLRSLVGAGVMMLFSQRWSALGGNALTHAFGWWFIFSALNLHFSGASFTLTRLTDLGLQAWRRRILVLGMIASVFIAALLRLPAELPSPPLGTGIDLPAASEWLVALTTTAPLSWLLAPFRIVVAPFLAVDTRAFFIALGPTLAVLTLHYLWVVKSAVAFEDAAVDYAQKRGARLAAWRTGGRRPDDAFTKARAAPFPLADAGRPELAFLWKNLLSTWPYFTVRVWGLAALVIAGAGIWLRRQPEGPLLASTVGGVALIFSAYVVIVGPQFARQDIRSDLTHADLLKTYPLPGWQIVLGELLAPTVILTGVLWLTLLTAVVTLQPVGLGLSWLTPSLRLAAGLGLACVAPVMVALQLLVPNAAALFFPGWFQMSRTRGGGPEVIGQRMIFFFAQVLTMLCALLPAFLVGGAVILMLHWIIGLTAAVVCASLAVWVVLAGEVWAGVHWLGTRFESLDLSADLRP